MDKRIIRIADEYGYDAQSRQCIEEMAELTQAINKFWRKQLKSGKFNLIDSDFESKEYNNLVEEIADVQIMLAQMENFLGCENIVLNVMEDKLNRQIQRIDDKKFEEV